MLFDCSDISSRSQHQFLNRSGKNGYYKQPLKDLVDVASRKITANDAGDIFTNLFALPVGLIAPFSSSIPSGFSSLSAANDFAIFGASSSRSAGTTVDGTVALTLSPSYHTHTFDGYKIERRDGGAGNIIEATAGHTHTIPSFEYSPKMQKLLFGKVSTAREYLSNNQVILTVKTLSGYSRVYSSVDRALAGGSVGVDDSLEITSKSFTTDTGDSSHDHTLADLSEKHSTNGAFYQNELSAAGSHSHSITVTISASLRKIYLGAWQSAVDRHSLFDGFMALWDGATAPDGWTLCDGNNGTVDVRDRFLMLASSGKTLGSKDGSGSFSTNVSSCSSAGGHAHTVPAAYDGISVPSPTVIYQGTAGDGAHSDHEIENPALSNYAPNSYALKAIMFQPY